MRLLWWKTKPEDSHLWRVKPVFHSWRQSFSSLHGWLTYPLDQVLNVHHSSCPQSCQCIVPLHSTADDVKGRIAKINKLSLHTIPNLVLQTNYIILKVVCLFCLTSAVRLLFVFCVCVCVKHENHPWSGLDRNIETNTSTSSRSSWTLSSPLLLRRGPTILSNGVLEP